MKHFAQLAILTLGLGLFAAVLSSLPNHPAAAAPGDPPSLPVKVTNTPLPVQGSVNAAVSGTVGATQSGPWNVGINGTPNVNVLSAPPLNLPSTLNVTGGPINVANTPATPLFNRDVDNPANQPFVGNLCIGSTGCGIVTTSFQVPATVDGSQASIQRLVIEYYSAVCGGVSSPVPTLDLILTSGGQVSLFFIGPLLADSSGRIYSNQATQIYADPGTAVQLTLGTIPVSFGQCVVTVSGHLVLQ